MLIVNADKEDSVNYFACQNEDLKTYLIKNGLMYVKSNEFYDFTKEYLFIQCEKLIDILIKYYTDKKGEM